MNQLLVTLLISVVAHCATETAAAGIVSNFAPLGTSNFSVDEGSTTAAYSQTATTLTLVSPFTLGDTLGGVFSSTYDWSAYSNTNNFTFGLYMSTAGASPGIPFTVELFNGALDAIVATYFADPAGLGASSTFIPMSFQVGGGSGNLSSIGGMQFTWNGGGTGTVVVDKIGFPTLADLPGPEPTPTPAAVPEPGTWAAAALLISGAVFVRLRRRRA